MRGIVSQRKTLFLGRINVGGEFSYDFKVKIIICLQITVGASDVELFGCCLGYVESDIVIVNQVGEYYCSAALGCENVYCLGTGYIGAVYR